MASYFVEDLGSSNGTLLNGHKLDAPLPIADGDTVSVGSRLLTIRILESDEEPEPSTLVLKDLSFSDADAVVPVSRAVTAPMRAVTAPMAVTLPPPMHQKCPRCAAPVSELDEECAGCGFEWGSFRPMSVTYERPNPINRRRHDRQAIELHLVYSSSELEIEAISRDLSESGVFVCSQVLDPIGTECFLTILVDGGPPIKARGVVRRVVEREDALRGQTIGLGVEFLGIGQAELSWIRTQMARMANAGSR
jgi:hypothetical protein